MEPSDRGHSSLFFKHCLLGSGCSTLRLKPHTKGTVSSFRLQLISSPGPPQRGCYPSVDTTCYKNKESSYLTSDIMSYFNANLTIFAHCTYFSYAVNKTFSDKKSLSINFKLLTASFIKKYVVHIILFYFTT